MDEARLIFPFSLKEREIQMKKRVYTLYRVSTKGQVEKDDIPMQKESCRDFAESQGFEDAGTVEEMMLYTELQSAVHAMIQRLEYSFTFNPSLLTSPKRKKQVTEILTEAEKYIWRIKEEIRCA